MKRMSLNVTRAAVGGRERTTVFSSQQIFDLARSGSRARGSSAQFANSVSGVAAARAGREYRVSEVDENGNARPNFEGRQK